MSKNQKFIHKSGHNASKFNKSVLNIVVNDAGLSGGSATVSYTVLSSDTKTSIASNLTSAINNNASL